MKSSLYTLLVILLLSSCLHSGNDQQSDTSNVNPAAGIDTNMMMVVNPPQNAEVIPDTVRIEGDFNGDSVPDLAFGVLFKAHSPEQDMQNDYIVRFSDKRIHPIPAIPGRLRLINEGDLNNDGRDEITIFRESLHGCMYFVMTYTNTNGQWRELADPWVFPYYCDFVSDEDLQNRIVLEDGTIYFYEADVNDENATLIKKELPVK